MSTPILSPTLTGLVDLVNPDLAAITVPALARGLSRPRWAFATELPVLITQHSLLVMEIFVRRNPVLRHAAIYALLHDGHEYLLGDLITPTVKLLARDVPGIAVFIDRHKARLDAAIRLAFQVPPPSVEILALVHEADQIAAAIEWRSLIPAANGACPFPPPPRGVQSRIKALAWPEAETRFRDALERELALKPWEMME